MAISPSMIPYERQANERMCGAAALTMVYRSLKMRAAQSEVWPNVSRPNSLGETCAHTHLLAQDAQRRGLGAVVMEVRRPLEALDWCRQEDLRVILNHRSNATTWRGHYSVLAGVNAANVVLHDPQFGPCRTEPREKFAWLWQPDLHPVNEITGNILVALAPETGTRWHCPTCRQEATASVRCPACAADVQLRPAHALGCSRLDCDQRIWRRLFCPACDAVVMEAPADELAGVQPAVDAALRADMGAARFEAVFVTMPRLLKLAIERAAPDRMPALQQVAAERERLIAELKTLLEPESERGRRCMERLNVDIAQLKIELDDVLKNPRPKRPNVVRARASLDRAKASRADRSLESSG